MIYEWMTKSSSEINKKIIELAPARFELIFKELLHCALSVFGSGCLSLLPVFLSLSLSQFLAGSLCLDNRTGVCGRHIECGFRRHSKTQPTTFPCASCRDSSKYPKKKTKSHTACLYPRVVLISDGR